MGTANHIVSMWINPLFLMRGYHLVFISRILTIIKVVNTPPMHRSDMFASLVITCFILLTFSGSKSGSFSIMVSACAIDRGPFIFAISSLTESAIGSPASAYCAVACIWSSNNCIIVDIYLCPSWPTFHSAAPKSQSSRWLWLWLYVSSTSSCSTTTLATIRKWSLSKSCRCRFCISFGWCSRINPYYNWDQATIMMSLHTSTSSVTQKHSQFTASTSNMYTFSLRWSLWSPAKE